MPESFLLMQSSSQPGVAAHCKTLRSDQPTDRVPSEKRPNKLLTLCTFQYLTLSCSCICATLLRRRRLPSPVTGFLLNVQQTAQAERKRRKQLKLTVLQMRRQCWRCTMLNGICMCCAVNLISYIHSCHESKPDGGFTSAWL